MPRLSIQNSMQELSGRSQEINAQSNRFWPIYLCCWQMLYPNQAKLDKHRTCHENKSCTTCGKVFGAKRNLRRHEKIKHEQNQMNISTNSNTSDGDDNGNAPIVQLD